MRKKLPPPPPPSGAAAEAITADANEIPASGKIRTILLVYYEEPTPYPHGPHVPPFNPRGESPAMDGPSLGSNPSSSISGYVPPDALELSSNRRK